MGIFLPGTAELFLKLFARRCTRSGVPARMCLTGLVKGLKGSDRPSDGLGQHRQRRTKLRTIKPGTRTDSTQTCQRRHSRAFFEILRPAMYTLRGACSYVPHRPRQGFERGRSPVRWSWPASTTDKTSNHNAWDTHRQYTNMSAEKTR